jgi:TrmH family RNA methyltransferase
MNSPLRITSRDNPLLVRVRKLARATGSRRTGDAVQEAWLEGEHLCTALKQQRGCPAEALVAESAWLLPRVRELVEGVPRVAVIPDALFAGLSSLESPAGIGFLWTIPKPLAMRPDASSVVLDRLQDPGNVGSIMRTAAAMGFTQVLAVRGTVGLWSSKVLRAGMGAHFGLTLHEGLLPADLDALVVPMLGTNLQAQAMLHSSALPNPCAWVFGHEGQGVDSAVLARCALQLRIAQPGGEESLNVAAAAAVCLYESCRQALARK